MQIEFVGYNVICSQGISIDFRINEVLMNRASFLPKYGGKLIWWKNVSSGCYICEEDCVALETTIRDWLKQNPIKIESKLLSL